MNTMAMQATIRATLGLLVAASAAHAADNGWSAYGADAGGTRYSTAKQITRANVRELRIAWQYHTHALDAPSAIDDKVAFETTPVLVDGMLVLTTPFNRVIALDPATGNELWSYDPKVDRTRGYSEGTSRGVATWSDARAPRDAPCRLRVFEGTLDARLIALDGKTGKPCADFGAAGGVDLTRDVGLGPEFRNDYEVTSAPTVVGDLVITGSAIGDNGAVDTPRGTVRAFDVRSGALKWSWDPILWAAQQQVRTGAANAWSTLAADPARDLVFIPTGSASPDYYGGARPGRNEWANSVVALKASTGEFVWGFQVAHHDIWDYDVPSQPTLIDFRGTPAVAVTTKIGHVFVLDRATGKPLHDVQERPVPDSDVAGEQPSPTQPFPTWSSMVPQSLSSATGWGSTPETAQWCREKIETLRNEGLFTPPSVRGTLVFPGNTGGVNWGGAAWDPERGLLVANTNRVAAIVKMIPREDLIDAFSHRRDTETAWGGEFGMQRGTPYGMHREWFVAPNRQPCNAPPWGAIVAFDVNTGTLRWQSPTGSMGDGWPAGSLVFGGPAVTASGLVFSAGTVDAHLRAYDGDTGRELWAGDLPASAPATPMTYVWRGKQYVVIAAGGHARVRGSLGGAQGDSVLAFALP